MSEFWQKKWNEIKEFWNPEKRIIFLITICVSMVVHFSLYTSTVTGADGLINSMYHQANVWEVMLLRFGLYFVQMVKGNIVSPLLVTLLSSIFLGITVVLTIEVLEIKNKYAKILTAVLFVAAPNISATLVFYYCSDAYILGMLLATLAVYMVRKHKGRVIPIVLGGLCLAFSMGMYQTYVAVTMVLCVATLLFDSIHKVEMKEIGITFLRYLLMGMVGIVLFYGISHFILWITKLPISTYSGANSIGLQTLLELPKLLPEAYSSFANYYFNDQMLPNSIWGTNILYILIFSAMLVAMLYLIVKNKVYEEKLHTILILILLGIAPICFGIIEIMVPDVEIHILMACAMILIFPIFFKLLELLPKNTLSKGIRLVVILCSIVIAWNYIWQDNASYIALETMQNQAEATISRIVTQVEQLDGYTQDMPVLFLGGLEGNSYLKRENTSMEAKKIYERSWGFVANRSTIFWGNLDSWQKILYQYEGVNWKLVSEWDSGEVLASEEYQAMNFYPEKDSIKIIHNTVVVKLSD